jgi:hypothetical protein
MLYEAAVKTVPVGPRTVGVPTQLVYRSDVREAWNRDEYAGWSGAIEFATRAQTACDAISSLPGADEFG